MKKNKGFTLIELIVTLSIVASIMIIAVVGLNKISKRKKEEAYKIVVNEVKIAAKQYFDTNEYLFEGLTGEVTGIISIDTLISNDYLNKVVDPRSGKTFSKCDQIEVVKKDNKYHAKYVKSKDDKCVSNNSIIVEEIGGPKISAFFYKIGDDISKISKDKPTNNSWYNLAAVNNDEKANMAVLVKTDENKNGPVLNIKINDSKTFNKNTIMDEKSFIGMDLSKTVLYTATNSSGKIAKIYKSAKIDFKKPTMNVNSNGYVLKLDKKIENSNDWYTDSVSISTSNLSSDIIYWNYNTSGLKTNLSKEGKKPSIPNFNITNEGKVKILYNLTDKAGNKNKIGKNVNIDLKLPSCKLSISGNNENGSEYEKIGWYTSNVESTVSCSDSVSGCEKNEYKTVVTTEQQIKKYNVNIYDKAGHKTVCDAGNIGIDRSKPICKDPSVSGGNDNGEAYLNNGWHTKNVTATAKCNDSGSGCVKNDIEKKYTTDHTKTNHNVTIKDKAGNSSTCEFGYFGIDSVSPTCSSKKITGTNKNGEKYKKTGWYTSDVTLSANCKDDTSKCYNDSISSTYDKEQAKTSYKLSFRDNAGNSSTCNFDSFGIDRQAPKVVYNRNPYPNTCLDKMGVGVDYTVSDSLSGILVVHHYFGNAKGKKPYSDVSSIGFVVFDGHGEKSKFISRTWGLANEGECASPKNSKGPNYNCYYNNTAVTDLAGNGVSGVSSSCHKIGYTE